MPDASTPSPSAPRILIIGGVAGGASAATRARRLNERAQIVIFEKDGYVSFANCGLPYYLGGEIQERSKLLVTTAEALRRRYRIEVHVRHEVIAVDRARRTVTVRNRDTGETRDEAFDQLILAPGASPIVPDLPGVDAPNVLTLRSVEDTDRIKAQLDHLLGQAPSTTARHAVVVGAGFIGLEMVEQLRHLGLAVSLIEREAQVLPLLDPEMASPLEDELVQAGVDLRLGVSLQRIETEGDRATAVTLSDGVRLPADLVILGIGVRPNVALATACDLALHPGGGIAADDLRRTNDPAIYAVGDASVYRFGPTGDWARIPLAGPANRAGRLAGQHAATGTGEPLAPALGTAIVRVFGLTAAQTGLSLKHARRLGLAAESVTVIANHHVAYYPGAKPITLKLIFDPGSGRVLGAQAIGEKAVDKRIDVLATAMAFGASVRQLTGLDLTYAPPFGGAKDVVHQAAFAATNVLDGLVKVLQPDADLSSYQVVDVRSEAEVKAAPLPAADHAVTIPLDDLRDRLGELDPSRPTVCTCQSGQRSYIASRILNQSGFREVYNLTGAATLRRRLMLRRGHATLAPTSH